MPGFPPRVHESIRINSDLGGVLAAIERIAGRERDQQSTVPQTHIVFLAIESNVHEIVRLPDLAKEAGISNIVVMNAIFIGSESQDRHRIFGRGEGEYESLLREAESKARSLGIGFRQTFSHGGGCLDL